MHAGLLPLRRLFGEPRQEPLDPDLGSGFKLLSGMTEGTRMFAGNLLAGSVAGQLNSLLNKLLELDVSVQSPPLKPLAPTRLFFD